ncbi:hypothetical protein D7X74_29440 [Corallococcus sp. CA047B]|uniref:SIR2 family protein n=1 Tax=Corallococcus sp. CA047B TaxID=2316729 RepID=UPI000EA3EB1A|nr:SIR2 family protein [Corallococcus sp. CA047B]RKH09522.1 hypothetical protein D7X74_29440 [Corallococcus sp. CA047B]
MTSSPRMTKSGQPIPATVQFLRNALDEHSILWVGAGVSVAAGYPSTGALIARMRERADDPLPDGDFTEIADAFIASRSRSSLSALLQEQFATPRPPTDFHYAVARLAQQERIQTIITTNYDDLLETALRSTGTPVLKQTLEQNSKLPHTQGVRLLKLHGSFEDWRNIVMSGRSYKEFNERYAILLDQLDVLCAQFPLLFVGASLQDPRILEWLHARSPAQCEELHPWRALMTQNAWSEVEKFEWKEIRAGEELSRTSFRPVILQDHAELQRLWKEASPPPPAAIAPPATKKPASNLLANIQPPQLDIFWKAWLDKSLPSPDLGEITAFMSDALLRLKAGAQPVFTLNLPRMNEAQAYVEELNTRSNLSPEERARRAGAIESFEFQHRIAMRLQQCIEFLLDEYITQSSDWGLISTAELAVVLQGILECRFHRSSFRLDLMFDNGSELYVPVATTDEEFNKLMGRAPHAPPPEEEALRWKFVWDHPPLIGMPNWFIHGTALPAILYELIIKKGISPEGYGPSLKSTRWAVGLH